MNERKCRDRLEESLHRISDPAGEGARACLTVYAEQARISADAADARARAGMTLGPLDGVIVSIKDLFDVAGEPTRAGSKVLAEEAKPAVADAPVVRRLRAAGATIVAKTNMTEFAFSGIGVNPHFGTPGNPADRSRIPGGSTSGGAVAVADGMCEIAIGTDTGGSTRIPAALSGIVGFKPSKYRVPTDGVFPLSYTLDSVGPMAKSVAECAAADAVLAGEDPRPFEPAPLDGLRFAICQGLPLLDVDDTVKGALIESLRLLSKNRVLLTELRVPLLDDMVRLNRMGGLAPPEAYAIHRERLAARGNDIDPAVRARIERGRNMAAADYVEILHGRSVLARAMDAKLADIDALVMPTTPIVAPKLEEVSSPEDFGRRNALVLRNPSIANFFDLCAVSVPLPRGENLPVGLMLIGRNGQDYRLLRIAAAVEQLLGK